MQLLQSPMRQRQLSVTQILLLGGAILTIIFLAYRHTLNNFFIGDDFPWFMHVIKMRYHFLQALQKRYNWTMSCLTFYLDFLLSGTQMWSYNLTNILIHLGCTVLVGLLGYGLTNSAAGGLLTMLLWGINAQGSEAVLWKTGRAHALVLLFMLGTLVGFIFLEQYKKRWLLLPTLLSAVCAHLALSGAVILPVLIGIYLVVFHGIPRTLRAWAAYLKHLSPFVAITGVYMFVYFFVYTPLATSDYYGEDLSVFLKFGRNIFHYLILFPDYFVQITYNETLTRIFAIFTLIAYVAALLLIKQKMIRFGLLFMAITMLPYLPVPLSVNYQSSRYRYIPLVGFSLVLTGAMMYLNTLWRSSLVAHRFIAACSGLFLIIFLLGNVYYIALDEMDYDRFGTTHERLVGLAQQIFPRIPLDRPVLFVNTSNLNAGASDFEQLYKPKIWFIRRTAPWKIVYLEDLLTVCLYANHQTGIFMTQNRQEISQDILNGHYTVLAFSDTGFYFPAFEPTYIGEFVENIGEHVSQQRIMAVRYLQKPGIHVVNSP